MDSTQTNEVPLFKIKDFKAQAKAQLKDKKKGLILSTLILFLFMLAIYLVIFPMAISLNYAETPGAFVKMYVIMLSFSLIFSILASILGFAILSVHFKLYKTQEAVTLGDLFKSFSIWKKAIGATLYKALFIILWELAVILPLGIIGGITGALFGFEKYVAAIILAIILFIAYIFAVIFLFSKLYQYSLMAFIIVDNPETSKIKESLKTSIKITKGYKKKLFLLDLSFIGWGILCMLTLGILGLWILPYYYMTSINAYQFIKKANNLEEEKLALESPSNEE